MKPTQRSILAVLTVLLAAAASQAQPPGEAAEAERALGFVRTLNSGDGVRLLAYMQENWVPAKDEAERNTRWSQFAAKLIEDHADVEIAGVSVERPGELTVLTRGSDGSPLSFIFAFESNPPYRIVSLSLDVGGGPAGAELPAFAVADGATQVEIAAALHAWFALLVADDLFSGTALVAWKGEPVFAGAWGLASKRWNVPNQPDTRFDLGSINKSFTKIAVGQLVSKGKLSLDDVIADHLPDYPSPEVARKVTLRNLLEHSAGLGDIFTEEFLKSDKAQYRQPEDFFWLFAGKEPEFEPGSRQSYSNAGFMVLGAIIAAVSGEPYDQYVIRHIFTPAGMDRAGFFAHDEPVADVAEGYTHRGAKGEEDAWLSNVLMLPARGNSAGSAQATAVDLLRFDNAIREYRLLSPAYTQWYFGGAEPAADEVKSAQEGRARAAAGIAGGAPGVSACLESDGDLAVIVLSNYDPPITEQVAQALSKPLARAMFYAK